MNSDSYPRHIDLDRAVGRDAALELDAPSEGRPAPASALSGRRIVIVLGPLELGGAERQALALASALISDYGALVHVVGTSGRGGRTAEMCEAIGASWSIVPAAVTVRPVGIRAAVRSVRRLWAFASSLRALRPDVLLPYMTVPDVNCGLTWRATGARACIWSQRVTGSEETVAFQKVAARLTPVAVANTRAGREYLVNKLGRSPSRVHMIGNGVVAEPPQRGRAEWREALDMPPNAVVVTMVANLHERKDHETLLDAWEMIMKGTSPPNAVLVLAGRFDSTHDRLMAKARDIGVSDSVRFAGEVRDVSGLYAASDICALSSHQEGMPNAILEGMFAGLPIVATDLPGIREVVGSTGHRYLFANGSAIDAAAHLRTFVGDASARLAVGALMRERAERQFSLTSMVVRTVRLIVDELAKGHWSYRGFS